MRSYLAFVMLLPVACSSVGAGDGETGEEGSGTFSQSASDPSSASTSGASIDTTGATDSGLTGDSAGPTEPSPTTTGQSSDPTSPTGSGSSTDAATGEDPTDPGKDPVPAGSRIPVGGEERFLLGANYPWKSYGGDFGGNAWGTYGVHTIPDDYAAQFQQMADAGLQVVRWFIFTDGRAGVIFDNSGTPSGLDPNVLVDFDAAIAIARDRGIYLVPVLFDFHWMNWGKQVNGVQVGGRSDTITDASKRAALVDKVVVPLLTAYADEPTVLAWEIMNEPEWSISDLPEGSPNGETNPVPLADFYALAVAVADAVHANTSAYVTLGSASLKWLKVWTPQFAGAHGLPPLTLDFYQAHYYPWMDGQGFDDHADYGTLKFSPFEQSYADLALDRPVVIGELVISDSAAMRLDSLVNSGYAGAWPWSLNADYSVDLPGIKAWAGDHADIADLPAP